MTVEIDKAEETFDGNDSATVFNTGFRVISADHLSAWLYNPTTGASTLLTQDLDYTVSNLDVEDETGCQVTYPVSGSPLATGMQLVVRRFVDYFQELAVRNQAGFNPVTLEQQLDLIVMQIQQLVETTDRALKIFVGGLPDIFLTETGYLYYNEETNTLTFNNELEQPCPVIVEVAGTAFTPNVTHGGKVLRTTSDSAVTINIAPQSEVGWPTHFSFSIVQDGGGAVTINPGTGVTLVYDSATFDPQLYDAPGSYVTLIKLATNRWLLAGALAEAV